MDNERKHNFYDKWSKTHYEHLTEDELKALCAYGGLQRPVLRSKTAAVR